MPFAVAAFHPNKFGRLRVARMRPLLDSSSEGRLIPESIIGVAVF